MMMMVMISLLKDLNQDQPTKSAQGDTCVTFIVVNVDNDLTLEAVV